MAYNKKDTYPSLKTPGVYPDETDKELGLDNDDLQKFSLGSWASINKNNRPFMADYLKKFTWTYDDSVEVEEIPISLLSLSPPYGSFMTNSLTSLSYRFKVEFYGWYLNVSALPEYIQNGALGDGDGYGPGFNYAASNAGVNIYIYYPYDPTIFPNPGAETTEAEIAALVASGYIGANYQEDWTSAVEFRNWTYEIHHGDTNISNSDIYHNFPTMTTWDEVYRTWVSNHSLSTFWDVFEDGDNWRPSPHSKTSFMQARIVDGGLFEEGSLLNTTPDGPGTPANPKIFATGGSITGPGSVYNGTFMDYCEASATRLREWLLANIFYLESNPVEDDDTYGSLTHDKGGQIGNPMKISFGETNQQELDAILNTALVVDRIPFEESTFSNDLTPSGLTPKMYAQQGDNNEDTGIVVEGSYASTPRNVLMATMKITPIFDRPTEYFNLTDVHAPSTYDVNFEIPFEYFKGQHPDGSDNYTGADGPAPFGHWIANAWQVQDAQNGDYLVNQDWYRRATYFVAAPLTLDESAEIIVAESDANYEPGEYFANFQNSPLFGIDRKDQNGKYNAYVLNLLNTEFPGYNWSPNLPAYGSTEHDNWMTYLTDVLGYPNYPWPPTITIGPDLPPDFGTILENNFNLFLSTLTSLENNTSVPGIEGFSANDQTLSFTRNDYEVSDVDFEVNAFYENEVGDTILKSTAQGAETKFLYYDHDDSNYNFSSYPVKVNIAVDLYGIVGFTNEQQVIDIDELEEIREDALSDGFGWNNFLLGIVSGAAASPETSIYRFQVVQWGDEKTLLTDESILNSYHFSMYDADNWPSIYDYSYKKQKQDQINKSKLIIESNENGELVYNLFSHTYNEPGVKSIKIMVYRYTKDHLILIESTLVTKNIVINDGLIKSQDFSIFGGTDFNFLPLGHNEAIIGGLDDDSKYNNSVEKIKKDDNFIQDDYLERVSSREFINNFNKKLYGETPGQLDLSTTRMYKKPLDIYDFINADKLKWITQGSGSLPINSSATDIFISNEDCIVDLNPQDMEYLSIQNKTGIPDKAILIGDYKVNQPKDGRVQKQGVMQTPLLEQNTDKQAF